MYFYNDPFMPLIFIALIFSFWAQWRVRSTYRKYSDEQAASGMSAAQLAKKILDSEGLSDIPVELAQGELTDHYDPREKVLRLSSGVYNSKSIAAYGIAAHEAGHAIQHSRLFAPLMLRNNFFPVANFGSNLGPILFFLGIIFSFPALMDIGIMFFALAVFFSLITLPVEFDASRRALYVLADGKYLKEKEISGARNVLNAAALTYLAATLMAVLQLARLLLLRNSRDD
jgi:hypothetical protein